MFRCLFIVLLSISLNLTAQETLTHFKSVNDYEFAAPSDWEVKEGVMGTEVILISPTEGDQDAFRENVNVVVIPIKVAVTPDEFYQTSRDGLKEYLTNFKMMEDEDVNLGGISAHKFVYSHQVGDLKAIAVQYLAMKGDKAYVFTFTATPESYEKYKGQFDEIAGSVKFNM